MNKLSIFFGALLISSPILAQKSKDKVKRKPYTIDVSYMDKKVLPNEDFFIYCNGKWIEENTIPASESRWGSFNELDQANNDKLIAILDGLLKQNYPKGTYEQIVGDFYASFLNTEAQNNLGIKPIKKELDIVMSMISYKDVSTVIGKQHANGISSLFNFYVDQDLKNVKEHVIYIGQGGLGLPNRDYYTQDNKKEIVEKYIKYVENLSKLYGFDEKAAIKIAKNVYAVENKLAETMMSPSELRIPEKSYNKFSYKEFREMMPGFDWDNYLSIIGSQKFENLIVGQPTHMKNINKYIKEFSLEQWKDYLAWKVMNHYASYLNMVIQKAQFDFYQGVLSGITEQKPIKERAISKITGMPISEALGKLFVDKHFSENAKNKVNEMVDNLLLTYNERINQLSWMSADTKKEALKKLNAIGRKLGYPSVWKDFSKIEINKENYCENIQALMRHEVLENLNKLYKEVDKNEWGMPAHMVNAYYHPLLNEIAFPAGIMQAPFFDEYAEDAVNYGRIGMVIGHEFTHGFDDMGSKFSFDGSFTNWWSETDRKLFEEKTTAFGETYSGFCPVENQCVNPELTMGENIADLGGITLAYYAYTKTEEYKSGDKKAGFTPDQRFFIAFAQLWKIKYTDEELKKRLATDPHSPGMYRVNGPLMNCPEFFKAFDIQEGDIMRNPEKKVARIW